MWVRITNGTPPPSRALLIEITPFGLSVSPRVAQTNCRVSSYPHNPFPCLPLPLGPAHHPSWLVPAAASSWPLVSSLSLVLSPIGPRSLSCPPCLQAQFRNSNSCCCSRPNMLSSLLLPRGPVTPAPCSLLNFLDLWSLLRLSPLPGQASPSTQKPLSSFQFSWKT